MEHLLKLKHRTASGEMRPTTVLTVTHPLDDVSKWDYLLYMRDGKSLDFGTYADLMKQKGPFWHFKERAKLISEDPSGAVMISPSGFKRLWPLAKVEAEDLLKLQ
eukprot:4237140-Pyramimonas_sp.AAC.2